MRSLLLVFISLYVVVGSEGLQVEGPSGPLQVQLGDSVLLPCSVRTPVPLEELEVEWRRSDSETMVLLFQDGEERGEEPKFRNRAHFFTEEISRGNFSLFLTNVTPADAGTYRCSVHTEKESGDTTALISVVRLVVSGGARAVSAGLGEDVILSCSVDSSEQIEEVVWKTDQDIIVLLYKDGEVLPDSSHERYRGRAEFFPAEIHKGNFSLRLKEVRTEDKGDFMCEVHTSLLSASTTVLLQDLGLSLLHVLILLLCIIAALLALSLSSFMCLKMRGRAPANPEELNLHCLLVFGPNVLLFAAFVLWGLTEGFPAEVVSSSALVLSRFLLLFTVALYVEQLPDIFRDIWRTDKGNTAALTFTGIMLGFMLNMNVKVFFRGRGYFTDFIYMFVLVFISRRLNEVVFISVFAVMMGLPVIFSILVIMVKRCGVSISVLFWIIFVRLWILSRLTTIGIVLYYFYQGLEDADDVGLMTVVVLLLIISMCDFLHVFHRPSYPESVKWIMYISGAVGLCVVNSVTLVAELVMKTRSGHRVIKDLRWAVFPSECVFVFVWCSLCFYYYEFKKIKLMVKKFRQICGRKWSDQVTDPPSRSNPRQQESDAGEEIALQPSSPQISCFRLEISVPTNNLDMRTASVPTNVRRKSTSFINSREDISHVSLYCSCVVQQPVDGSGTQTDPPAPAAEETDQLLNPNQSEEKNPAELRARRNI
ncbi:uncharacterized protein LOC114766344 isoform X3 [Denticeps clupeoides]|uniref:uncharacterized protein LOC114766344 isoform X3 n=1 Tax=Denticeps clupeoides TaxID=299321 RepID=UPI0010A428B6|nr:uncharacterized protein LOC114766344 isoform X3 [Denticeps clupeoides]